MTKIRAWTEIRYQVGSLPFFTFPHKKYSCESTVQKQKISSQNNRLEIDQLLCQQMLIQQYIKLKARNNNRRKECSQQQEKKMFNCSFVPFPMVLFHLTLYQPFGSLTALYAMEISCTSCCMYLARWVTLPGCLDSLQLTKKFITLPHFQASLVTKMPSVSFMMFNFSQNLSWM